jgi:hypothetical protein
MTLNQFIRQYFIDTFTTATGVICKLNDPLPEVINIKDISIALSNQCFHNGMIPAFYSIAQHCVLQSRLAPDRLKRVAFLYDFYRAYLGTLVEPLKMALGERYILLEAQWQAAIFSKFMVPISDVWKLKPILNEARRIEQLAFKEGNPVPFILAFYGPLATIENPLTWGPNYARERFLMTFDALFYDYNSSLTID